MACMGWLMRLIRIFAGLLFAALALLGCPREEQPPQANGETPAPQITVVKERVKAGDPIEVHWTSAPANERAWIGVYNANDPDLEHVIGWENNVATDGELIFRPADFRGALPPGDYKVRLMRADRTTELASAQVSVFDPEDLP